MLDIQDYYIHLDTFIEGSLEVKLPTICRGGQSQRREEQKREDQRRERERGKKNKEDAGARKGSKVAKHSVFPMICGSRGSKSRLAKAVGAEQSG